MRHYELSEASKTYKFKMTVFDNGQPIELLLLFKKSNKLIDETRIKIEQVSIGYLRTILHG